jgi:maltodextrin utilization protein YvdJ
MLNNAINQAFNSVSQAVQNAWRTQPMVVIVVVAVIVISIVVVASSFGGKRSG